MKIEYTTRSGITKKLSTEGLSFESRLKLLIILTKLQLKLEAGEIESVFIDGVEKDFTQVVIEKWVLFNALVAENEAK